MKGMKTGGRVAGTPNKFTANVKQAFVEAFEKLGGVDALVTWGKRNPTEFYRLVSKIIPIDMNVGITVTPEARVYPLGLPQNEQTGLPATSQAMDSLH